MIALIKSRTGLVFGVANLVDAVGPLSAEDLDKRFQRHQVPEQMRTPFEAFKWRHAWVLENVRVLRAPIPYVHRQGAVIFTTLDEETVQEIEASLKVGPHLTLRERTPASEYRFSGKDQKMATNRNSEKKVKAKTMNKRARQRVLEISKTSGFLPLLSPEGSDHYAKLIILRSPQFPVNIYVDKETGMDSGGDPSWLKVCISPRHYEESAEALDGITPLINNRIEPPENLFKHSAFVDCPAPPGKGEPSAKCYKVTGWDALGALFGELKASRARKREDMFTHSDGGSQ
jgi:hypothetical protein